MKLTQIHFCNPNTSNDYVNYNNKLLPRYLFGDEEHKRIYQTHNAYIMQNVEDAIFEYLNCANLCNDNEGMFPQPKCMTGEWYLGQICFEEHFLGIEIRFIGIDTGRKDDYLSIDRSCI